jgi:hypothetical protein
MNKALIAAGAVVVLIGTVAVLPTLFDAETEAKFLVSSAIQRANDEKTLTSWGLARFPIRWNHLIEKNSRQFKNLGARPCRKSGSTFPGHALTPQAAAKAILSLRR